VLMCPLALQSFHPFPNTSKTNEREVGQVLLNTGTKMSPGYWTEVHQIFAQCSEIIAAVNAGIYEYIAIFQFVVERQYKE